MSEYNSAFDFNTLDGEYDMPGSLDAEPSPIRDQSGAWNAALHPLSGSMEGGTALQLHARLDLAPFGVARSNGRVGPCGISCATCVAPFPTESALHQHAKETEHQAYKCKCGTGFNKHSSLKRHINTKDAPKTFACTLCYDKFTRKDKLKDHCRHYHKVTDEGLRALFDAQEANPRPAAPRRLRARVPLNGASSGSAPAPALAPAPSGPSVWSPPAYTGQQHASFSTDLCAPVDPLVTTSSFAPAADPFTSALIPGEDVADALDDIFGDAAWTTGFDGFNF